MKPEPLPPPSKSLAIDIIGIWTLVSREDYDKDGKRIIDPILGAHPMGIFCVGPRHFSAQFMNRERNASSGPSPAPQPTSAGANNSAAVNGYDAYFGTYLLDVSRGVITTTLEGSVSMANVGKVFEREIRVSGNLLWIRLSTTAFDGTPVTRTNTFERVG
jgi:lipocalin-like protein